MAMFTLLGKIANLQVTRDLERDWELRRARLHSAVDLRQGGGSWVRLRLRCLLGM